MNSDKSLDVEASVNDVPFTNQPAQREVSVERGEGGVVRGLEERHLSMIALAGMIGTGLFLSTGKALATAGPLGLLLGYTAMGIITACIAYISAEISALRPLSGGFARHATLYIDKSTSIVLGWNFAYSMAVTMPAEVSAATSLITFWNPNLSSAVGTTVFWIVIVAINFAPVRWASDTDLIPRPSICLIVGLIFGGLILDLGGVHGQERLGFRYWKSPYEPIIAAFATGSAGRFLSWWNTLIAAAFAYGNMQVVATAGAETRDPRRAIPRAVRATFWRVVGFYIVSVLLMGMIVPSDDPSLTGASGVSASPFVIAFNRAGVKALPSIINAVILTSAFSSDNSCTILASRTLHGLALDGFAPKVLHKLTPWGVPWVCVSIASLFGALAYLVLNTTALTAFGCLVNIFTTAGLLSWVIICVVYLRFHYGMKHQGIDRDRLPYKAPFQPYATWFAMLALVLIVLTCGFPSFTPSFSYADFLTYYLNLLIFVPIWLIVKIIRRDSPVKYDDMDFEGPLAQWEEETARRTAEGMVGQTWFSRLYHKLRRR